MLPKRFSSTLPNKGTGQLTRTARSWLKKGTRSIYERAYHRNQHHIHEIEAVKTCKELQVPGRKEKYFFSSVVGKFACPPIRVP
jgi:hypothetical protein